MSIPKHELLDTAAFRHELAAGADPLPLFRDALAHGRASLKSHHLQGAAGADIVYGHAWLVDQLLVQAWQHHLARRKDIHNVALVAVGGYGRGELHPASDVDLMILLERSADKTKGEWIESFLRFLWDIGLEVGHSVRTVKECIAEAKKDITVATNLTEARLLHGDTQLFDQMLTRTGPDKIWPPKAFFQAKFDEQRARHERFHDTAYNLEPNLKEGPGGLRDIHVIGWVTQRHFRASSLQDLVAHGFLTEKEHRALIRGRNFLWKLRNGLHFLTGRREDRLLFDHQRVLAEQMGFQAAPGDLAVEQLMKRYYRAIKELALLNEILLQHFQEELLARKQTRIRKINRRFRAHKNFLEVTNDAVFIQSPFAMLEMFLILQQDASLKGVRASTIRLVRENLHLIDQKFRKDIACRSLFMEIMRQRRGQTHVLRQMNAYGVLGAYIPAFGRIVGQMQHDLFHEYTVDEHTLFVVRNLRRLTVPEFRHEFPMASTLIDKIVKPERLYLAAMFHDIAKGRGGDHSKLGEKDAYQFCRHHDMSEYDARFVAWLVRNHLVMSYTAQREDIDDPEVVRRFAEKVGDEEILDNLFLLTMADMRGTSPKVWNAWKGRLLTQLYGATVGALRSGSIDPLRVEHRIEDLQNEAHKFLQRSGVSAEQVANFWPILTNDYYMRHDAESIAWHAECLRHTASVDLPLVAARHHPGHDGVEVLIFAPDRVDLFANSTGGFDLMNLDIADAKLHVTKTGFALHTFVVFGPQGASLTDGNVLNEVERNIRTQLVSPRDTSNRRGRALRRSLKHFPNPTTVTFAPGPSGETTVMEVSAQDRPGLLHQVACALQQCRVRVVAAKAATYGERVEDIFYVTSGDGSAMVDQEHRDCVTQELLARLEESSVTATGSTHAEPGVITV